MSENQVNKRLLDAIALVEFGPCKTANRPQDWVNVASPMCAHCLDGEDVNFAAARIILDDREKLRSAVRALIDAKGRHNTMLAYKALEEFARR